MTCPFPGFDPYIKSPAVWPDFHISYLTYLREAIADRLPRGYDARMETQLRIVEVPPVEEGTYRPDISVSLSSRWRPSATEESSVATLEPTAVIEYGEPVLEEVREARINIYRRPGSELITAIELLSPWNKTTGEGLNDFARKRRALLLTPVNWVEIDFLRGGSRAPWGPPIPPSDYLVMIARAEARGRAEIYSWNLRDPMPSTPVPLRSPDSPIPISLAEVFADTYRRSHLDRVLIELPPGPPPNVANAEDRAWAEQLAATRERGDL